MVNSCINMLMGIKVFCKRELCDKDLDDFYDVNHMILDGENEIYLDKKQYQILSLLSIAFIDLGLLSFEYTESEND